MREIELLCPAKNLETGIQAILHGADAVYIGASGFGARAAAGNSIEDIAQLCAYAHKFRARVYVTINTILYDSELAEVEHLVHRLYQVGVDALIVQDLALLNLNLPPIALHASTQMDNRTLADVRHREHEGFTRVVLARELPLDIIQTISENTSLDIEAFVHGALCVSYSGRCYASQYCFNRSANRGRCAQFCRLPFDLVTSEGEVVERESHLLSLKDMCRIDYLEPMIDAGVMSFKIEGRLKDVDYVKNITAAYRQALDEIIARRPEELRRSSLGVHTYTFSPHLERTFTRGYTPYFLMGEGGPVHNPFSPKSIGQYVGKVVKSSVQGIKIAIDEHFTDQLRPGDGICYICPRTHVLRGNRVNTINGEMILLNSSDSVPPVGVRINRNFDIQFEKELSKQSAQRHLPITIKMEDVEEGFMLTAITENGIICTHHLSCEKEIAQRPMEERIRQQLSKLGGTLFTAVSIQLNLSSSYFVPLSLLSEARRQLIRKLEQTILDEYTRETPSHIVPDSTWKGVRVGCHQNISNRMAYDYLKRNGAEYIDWAFEIDDTKSNVLMTCKHCILRHTNRCMKKNIQSSKKKPRYYLKSKDGRLFLLQFDCGKCEMKVMKEESV